MPWYCHPIIALAWSFPEHSILVTPTEVFLKAQLSWDEMRRHQYLVQAELHRDLIESHNFFKNIYIQKTKLIEKNLRDMV